MTRAEAARINGLLGGTEPRHGHTVNGKKTRVYMAWRNMNQRCTNAKRVDYHGYGGRGIAVCERWRESFEAFLEDMGEPAPGYTLERKDNDRGYEPGNCLWATRRAQRRNTCTVRLSFEIAEDIRRRVVGGAKQLAIARELSVTPSLVNAIVKGRVWRAA